MSVCVCVLCVFTLVLCLRFVRFTLDYWWRALLGSAWLCSAMSVSTVCVCVYSCRMYCTYTYCSMYLWFGLVLRGRIKSQLYWKRPSRCHCDGGSPCDINSNSAIIVECMKCKCCGKKKKNTLQMCKFFQLTDRKCTHHFSHPHFSPATFRLAYLCRFFFCKIFNIFALFARLPVCFYLCTHIFWSLNSTPNDNSCCYEMHLKSNGISNSLVLFVMFSLCSSVLSAM